jgi:hypothetical protein
MRFCAKHERRGKRACGEAWFLGLLWSRVPSRSSLSLRAREVARFLRLIRFSRLETRGARSKEM